MWAGHLVDVLASAPRVRIVLSTSWARELRFARARDYLPAELRTKVIGATWHSGMATDDEHRPLGRGTWWDRATRYQQIRRYVDRAGITDWIAVDDQPEGWADGDRDKLVATDSRLGLSAPSARVRLAAAVGYMASAWAVADAMAQGRLVQLAPEWQAPPLPISLVLPPTRFQPARLRVFIQLMRAHLPTVPGVRVPGA